MPVRTTRRKNQRRKPSKHPIRICMASRYGFSIGNLMLNYNTKRTDRMKKCILLLALPLLATDWPQWRGAERKGVSPETGLLKSWPAGGPPLVWKAQGLGEGYSAFSVSGGLLFTQGQRGDQEFVLAIDTRTGKKAWETLTGKPFREQRGHGPRGTPTLDGDYLYAMAADGTLVCLEKKSGNKLWIVDLMKRLNTD